MEIGIPLSGNPFTQCCSNDGSPKPDPVALISLYVIRLCLVVPQPVRSTSVDLLLRPVWFSSEVKLLAYDRRSSCSVCRVRLGVSSSAGLCQLHKHCGDVTS